MYVSWRGMRPNRSSYAVEQHADISDLLLKGIYKKAEPVCTECTRSTLFSLTLSICADILQTAHHWTAYITVCTLYLLLFYSIQTEYTTIYPNHNTSTFFYISFKYTLPFTTVRLQISNPLLLFSLCLIKRCVFAQYWPLTLLLSVSILDSSSAEVFTGDVSQALHSLELITTHLNEANWEIIGKNH